MRKLIAIRVKEETAQVIYRMAEEQNRNPGAQIDVIVADYLEHHSSPATGMQDGGSPAASAPAAVSQR